MAHLCGPDVASTTFDCGNEELDHVPLMSRRNLLFSPNTPAVDENQIATPLPSPAHVLVKEEDECCDSQQGEEVHQQLPQQDCYESEAPSVASFEVDRFSKNTPNSRDEGSPINCNSQENQADPLTAFATNIDAARLEKIDVNNPPLEENPVFTENLLLNSSKEGLNDSASKAVPTIKTEENKPSDLPADDLDHIVLKERQRSLLKRKFLELAKPVSKGNFVGLSEDLMEYSAVSTKEGSPYVNGPAVGIKEEFQFAEGGPLLARNEFNNIPKRDGSDYCQTSVNDSNNGITCGLPAEAGRSISVPVHCLGTEASMSGTDMEESDKVCPPERTLMDFNPCDGDYWAPASINSIGNSILQASVEVKVEPLECSDKQNIDRNTLDKLDLSIIQVKREQETDSIDHMPLRERMKLLISLLDSELNTSIFGSSRETVSSTFGCGIPDSESAKPTRIIRPRKRKKTATDSVETALEEDAPGLLRVLLDQGVSVGEIKLYGETESDDAIDESSAEDSFSELEAVITKLFSQQTSFLKFAPIRCSKGSKRSYCLACLFSLVEQTRYLQFHKWPVEWGWCRDLQSFIFVFKRHNRIVLERPEYGYATYFFELVDSSSIAWQVKRLVTAMKLTSCGRITLIENKPLAVGEDLSEGEAKVLMEYGWIPNTGLGTMLNYRERVVHDRKNESDSSEWRSKIAKLLMDGYTGGTIVSTTILKLEEYLDDENMQIKLEQCSDDENMQIKSEL